jgi:hypothetical protein
VIDGMAQVHITEAELARDLCSVLKQVRQGVEVPLASEPVWLAALEQVRREIANGLPGDEWLSLAGRSAEVQATNDSLNKGSQPQNIVRGPSIY